MVINEETIKKIEDAWQYGAASTGQFAMREMDRFTDCLIRGNSIFVEMDNLHLSSLLDFVVWKNKRWILSQISICNSQIFSEKINTINKLIAEFKPNKAKFIETDANTHSFTVTLYSDYGSFKLFLGELKELDSVPAYTVNIDAFTVNIDYDLELSIKNGTKRKLLFTNLELK